MFRSINKKKIQSSKSIDKQIDLKTLVLIVFGQLMIQQNYTPVNGLSISWDVCWPSNIVLGILVSEPSQQLQFEVPLTCMPTTIQNIHVIRELATYNLYLKIAIIKNIQSEYYINKHNINNKTLFYIKIDNMSIIPTYAYIYMYKKNITSSYYYV